MNIRAAILLGVASAFMAGCGSISVPASGETATGEKFFGQATASLSEKQGKFIFANAVGVNCTGTYDQYTKVRELDVAFSCTDGRTGTMHIVRNPNLLGGVGALTFADGVTGTFVFGRDSGA